MLLQCQNKGCYEQTHAKLDRDSGIVYCEKCGGEITVPAPTKKVLESMGQVIRSPKTKAFYVFCHNCKGNRDIEIKNDEAFCKVCDSKLNVSKVYLQSVKQFNKK